MRSEPPKTLGVRWDEMSPHLRPLECVAPVRNRTARFTAIDLLKKGKLVNRFRKLISALVVLVAAASSVFAQNTIRWDTNDWTTLDPAYLTLQQESAIAMNIFSGLVNFAPGTTQIVPDLAESWDISEDGLTYTFTLRQGLEFHHGYGPVTANDVVYSYTRILNPDTAASLAANYSIIQSVEALGDRTVQITIQRPYAPFLLLLVPYKATGIVPQAAVEEFGEGFGLNPIGTGPFEWVSGDPRGTITLRAFEQYYQGRSEVDVLQFLHIPENSVAYAAFEAGDLNMVKVRDADALARFLADPTVRVATSVGTNLNYVILNPNRAPFDDIRVRQALQYAIDKDLILETVLEGISVDATGPVPQSANYYYGAVERYPYDPELARELLAEAGYPNGFEETLYTYIGGPAVPVMTVIQDMLRQVGVNITIRALEIADWSQTVRASEIPGTFMRITRSGDPHEYLFGMLNSASIPANNYGRYVNPQLDELINIAGSVTDEEERARLYAEIQELVVGEAVNIWLFSDINATAYRPEITDFVLDPLNNQTPYTAKFGN